VRDNLGSKQACSSPLPKMNEGTAGCVVTYGRTPWKRKTIVPLKAEYPTDADRWQYRDETRDTSARNQIEAARNVKDSTR